MTVERMEGLLREVHPWPTGSNVYGDKNWENIISVAKDFQKADPVSVERTLCDYQNETILDKGMIHGDKRLDFSSYRVDPELYQERLEEDGKLLLLMRVIFDLPEHAAPAQRNTFFGWITYGQDVNPDGSVNIAWPLSWTNATPKLLSGQTGIQGIVDVYDVLSEYKHFYSHYHFRSL
jgi:hypothetical protein